jgi:hypothetical protein
MKKKNNLIKTEKGKKIFFFFSLKNFYKEIFYFFLIE